jgi:hypothetical protein
MPSSDSPNWNDPGTFMLAVLHQRECYYYIFVLLFVLVPVYDGRFTGFDAAVDIDNIDKIFPV